MRDDIDKRVRTHLKLSGGSGAPEATVGEKEPANLEQNPEIALSLLEADQTVVAKERTRFGRRRLSRGEQALLWGLRIYVVVMLVIVVFWAFGTMRGH